MNTTTFLSLRMPSMCSLLPVFTEKGEANTLQSVGRANKVLAFAIAFMLRTCGVTEVDGDVTGVSPKLRP